MTAIELLQNLALTTWVTLALLSIGRAVRQRTAANLDVALFFTALAGVSVAGRVLTLLGVPLDDPVRRINTAVAMTIPYFLIRIIDHFAGVDRRVLMAATVGMAAAVVLAVAVGTSVVLALLYIVAYFAVGSIYAAVRSIRLSRRGFGVTRRRMRAIAGGSYFLGVAVLAAGVGLLAPPISGFATGLTQLFALASSVSYAIGFNPPAELRKYWQIPEFRSFVGRSAVLPRLSLGEIAQDVAEAAGRALGARGTVGLWDEAAGVLRFSDGLEGVPSEIGPSDFITWRVFRSQKPIYVPDAATAAPAHAAAYRAAGMGPVLAAPITAGDQRLGVLAVYSSRQPIFAEDDLSLVQLIAGQAAVLLESRRLIDDAARVRAVEETARLKEDFISAAAHDLKTPLTTIVAQAQLLERRAEREGRVAELPGLQRLVREAAQLSRLVEELLDASRLERGALPIHREDGDLAAVVRDVVSRERPGRERVELEVVGDARGSFDRERVAQLVDNLVENALKYSPAEGPVTVRLAVHDGEARIAVTDRGIGIPPEDVPHVFDRFRRGSNVDHRRYSGIGLGLYICRGIVEQHGGRIWVETAPGRGTTFHVSLPVAPASDDAAIPARMVAS